MKYPGMTSLCLLLASATLAAASAAEATSSSPKDELTAITINETSAEEVDVANVPEPASFALVGIGGLLMILRKRRGYHW